MLIAIFLAPMLATALLSALLIPLLVRMHVAAATAPRESLPADGWALGLLDALDAAEALLDVDAGWLALDAAPARTGAHQRAPRRMARATQRSRMHAAAWALAHAPRPIASDAPAPATMRVPYAPAWHPACNAA